MKSMIKKAKKVETKIHGDHEKHLHEKPKVAKKINKSIKKAYK